MPLNGGALKKIVMYRLKVFVYLCHASSDKTSSCSKITSAEETTQEKRISLMMPPIPQITQQHKDDSLEEAAGDCCEASLERHFAL